MICYEKGDGYYDSFKKASLRRLELGKFWDQIIEMCESHEQPTDFQSRFVLLCVFKYLQESSNIQVTIPELIAKYNYFKELMLAILRGSILRPSIPRTFDSIWA